MLNKIKTMFPNFFVQDVGTLTLEEMERAYETALGHELHPVLEEKAQQEQLNAAQQIVNDALARYCELCRKGFAHPGLAKNHKRLKHKS